MTTPQEKPQAGWTSLDPWEKARQWEKSSPGIASDMLRFAKLHAAQELKLREMQIEAEREAAAFDQAQQKAQAAHNRSMEVRDWWIRFARTVGGLGCIAGLIFVGLQYAKSGNAAAGAAVFGLGSALTAGVFGVNRYLDKRQKIAAHSAGSDSSRSESA